MSPPLCLKILKRRGNIININTKNVLLKRHSSIMDILARSIKLGLTRLERKFVSKFSDWISPTHKNSCLRACVRQLVGDGISQIMLLIVGHSES
jgi:hypothetical protein